MGGAFTGVADDVNAIYWNPAGLGLNIEKLETTGMLNVSKINNSNYDLYLAGAVPEKTIDVGIAGAIVYDITDFGQVNVGTDIFGNNLNANIKSYTTYYQGGLGKEIFPGFAVGLNGKAITSRYETQYDSALYADETESFGIIEADAGVLYTFGPVVSTKNTMFSLGLLVQNFLDTKTSKYNMYYPTNIRPGFSFRPIRQVLLAVEEYDASGNESGSRDLRAGLELKFFEDILALRTGIYHANTKILRARTYGIGLSIAEFAADITLMDWEARDNEGNKVTTVFLGGGFNL